MILGLLAVLVVLVLTVFMWMAVSLLVLAHRIGEPRKRPTRRYSDGSAPPVH
jgi:hypothetical protein